MIAARKRPKLHAISSSSVMESGSHTDAISPKVDGDSDGGDGGGLAKPASASCMQEEAAS